LAAALGRYVQDQDLRQRRGRAGRARVEAKFSLPAMVSAYTDLYDALLAGRRPAWASGRSAIPAEPRGH
jgi:glycosyltransferase involved in cell wall biosynthesis